MERMTTGGEKKKYVFRQQWMAPPRLPRLLFKIPHAFKLPVSIICCFLRYGDKDSPPLLGKTCSGPVLRKNRYKKPFHICTVMLIIRLGSHQILETFPLATDRWILCSKSESQEVSSIIHAKNKKHEYEQSSDGRKWLVSYPEAMA